jgi:hypothetical protein
VSTSTGYGYRACPNHDCCSIRSAETSPALHVGSCWRIDPQSGRIFLESNVVSG